MNTGNHRSIGEVLHSLENEFPDVTISKIRFLESQGLLNPERTPSGYRKFYDKDVDRLRWVLVQQRDNFLPLRVIKQRLDSGDWGAAASATNGASGPNGSAASAPPANGSDGLDGSEGSNGANGHAVAPALAAPAPAAPAALVRNLHPLDRGPSEIEFTVDELANAASLEISQIRDLHKFGLIEPVRQDPPIFDGDSLVIAKAAAGFMGHGLEARHLKAWRVAAEREAGTLEQLALPLARAGNSAATGKAVEMANDLVVLGADLREAMLRRYLRASFGLD